MVLSAIVPQPVIVPRPVIVLSGGEPVYASVRAYLPHGCYVIAADSGYKDAAALGLTVDLLVGDLDSIDPADLRHAETTGTRINHHPVDKDETDLDLALHAARETGARTVTVISGGGGRLDHLVGGIALLGSTAHADLVLDAWIGPAHITVVHGPGTASFVGRPSEMVTVLAIGGPAAGIVTEGLRFVLNGETLRPGESRGLSNELIGERARLLLESGTVLIIRPDALNEQKEPR